LMLRGPQTAAELRDRASRMYRFSDVDEVEICLARLHEDPRGALVVQLPRQPGQKEQRYTHLLSGEPEIRPDEPSLRVSGSVAGNLASNNAGNMEARVAALETELREVRDQVTKIKQELGLS